jgi:hypothetical protein
MTSGFTDLPILAELGNDLERAWREAEAAPPGRVRRGAPLRPSLVAALVLLALLLAAAALAASGLLGGGAPLKPPRGTSRDPHSGLGVSRAGSAQVLPVALADPAGGPPWGIRYVTTSRGLGCLQAGRLVDGKIGVLGQDGAFADDGRFHPLTRNYLGGIAAPFACGTLDAHGHAFASVAMHGVPASGLLQVSATQPGCLAHRDHGPLGARQKKIPICPRKDWRRLYFGMAGPEAKSVTYAGAGGRLHTVATVSEQGAYLIVLKASVHARGLGQYTPLDSAGAGLVRVTYRDGSACRVGAAGDVVRPCPHVGEVPVPRPRLTQADVAAPVTATIEKRHGRANLVVRFTARIAVTDASSTYTVFVRFPGSAAGINCGGAVGGPLIHDVKAGQTEHFNIATNGCRGRFHGSVVYRHGQNSSMFAFGGGGASLTVGTFTIDVR